MPLVRDGELAVSQRVPQLDCSIARTRDDLPIISGEGNGEDVVAMANKSTGRNTGG